jgi:hypothetical protein
VILAAVLDEWALNVVRTAGLIEPGIPRPVAINLLVPEAIPTVIGILVHEGAVMQADGLPFPEPSRSRPGSRTRIHMEQFPVAPQNEPLPCTKICGLPSRAGAIEPMRRLMTVFRSSSFSALLKESWTS